MTQQEAQHLLDVYGSSATVDEAAERLGMDRRTLYRRLARLAEVRGPHGERWVIPERTGRRGHVPAPPTKGGDHAV